MAVRRNGCRYILSCDVSDTKPGYKPLHQFEEARRVDGIDPWIFVTDGLTVFVKAASKAFRRREGFRLMHIRDIHLKNTFNTNNLYQRLNGLFKDYIKTARGFKLKPNKKTTDKLGGGCPALLQLLVVHHNFFRPPEGPDGRTPAEAAGIIIRGDNECIIMMANAAQAWYAARRTARGHDPPAVRPILYIAQAPDNAKSGLDSTPYPSKTASAG